MKTVYGILWLGITCAAIICAYTHEWDSAAALCILSWVFREVYTDELMKEGYDNEHTTPPAV